MRKCRYFWYAVRAAKLHKKMNGKKSRRNDEEGNIEKIMDWRGAWPAGDRQQNGRNQTSTTKHGHRSTTSNIIVVVVVVVAAAVAAAAAAVVVFVVVVVVVVVVVSSSSSSVSSSSYFHIICEWETNVNFCILFFVGWTKSGDSSLSLTVTINDVLMRQIAETTRD